MYHFQGEFGGEDHHWFGELERCPHRFWYQISNFRLYLHAFHIHHSIARHGLLFIMIMPCSLISDDTFLVT